MRTFVMIFCGSLLASLAALAADLPTPDVTPGEALAHVSTANAAQCLTQKTGQPVQVGDPITQPMICTSGYTQCVRNVSSSTKNSVYRAYGLQGNHMDYCSGPEGCEVDHLVPLEVGGANTVKNLWPQSFDTSPWNAHVKDKLENYLHVQVCAGRMPLQQAQQEIAIDWITAYKKYIGEP